jgi:hypothetical protein
MDAYMNWAIFITWTNYWGPLPLILQMKMSKIGILCVLGVL